jgi:GTP cyclohydrolase I
MRRAGKLEEPIRMSDEPEILVAGRVPAIAVAEPVGSQEEQEEKVATLAHHVRGILSTLGLDLADPNLAETDIRVAKMYLEMFGGLAEGAEPKVTTFPNQEGYSHMVMEKQIPFYSMCAHHLIPFYGHAHIAYIPRDRILGLSKFARILEFYAKRPQLQERLTEQVVTYLEEKLQPMGAMVVIEARHLCVEMRGVKKPGALTVTSALRGIFHQKPVREEFLDLLRRHD